MSSNRDIISPSCRSIRLMLCLMFACLMVMPTMAKTKLYDATFSRTSTYSEEGVYRGIATLSSGAVMDGMTVATVVDANSDVIDSDAGDVTVSPESISVSGNTAEIALEASFAASNGEYSVSLELMDGDVVVMRSIRCFVVSDGVVYDGANYEDALGQEFIVKNFPNSKDSSELSKEDNAVFDVEFKKVLEAREKAKSSKSGETKASGTKAINNGDTITVEAKWKGLKPDGTFIDLPIQGAELEVQETGGAMIIRDIFTDATGKVSFTAWKDNPTFNVYLNGYHGGIGGKNRFKIWTNDNAADNTAELMYAYVGDETNVNAGKMTYTAPNPGPTNNKHKVSSMWSAFHMLADIYKVAKDEMAISSDNIQDVFFGAINTVANNSAEIGTFVGNSRFGNGVYILSGDRYDIDVIAHELGHQFDNDASAINGQGGKHNGSNQYDYPGGANGNPFTNQNKQLSNRLAMSEGFANWLGIAIPEKSAYKGTLKNVGNKRYEDTEDANLVMVPETNKSGNAAAQNTEYRGEDTEQAIMAILWDLYDGGPENYSVLAGLTDQTAMGLGGVWTNIKAGGALKADNLEDGIHSFWQKHYLPGNDVTKITINGLRAAETFAQMGVAPVLTDPIRNTKLEILNDVNKPLIFKWKKNNQTGNAIYNHNEFKLVLYKADDLTSILFQKDVGNVVQYELTLAEKNQLVTTIDTYRGDIMAVVYGKSTTAAANGHIDTGFYASNGNRLLLQDINRFAAMVVDSSGSNTSTDPNNLRIAAAKASVRRLISQADAAADPTKVPDEAAAIDFDSSVRILSNFADPDVVEPTLNAIDSSGGTQIDFGINAAINLLDAKTLGLNPLQVRDRSAIFVFTDGQNGSGIGPVITAIINAINKGYRVHYGFLQPQNFKDEAYFTDPASKELSFSTIQEAVLASGGTYGVIGSAESQFAFVDQVFQKGLTNIDSPLDVGGQDIESNITNPATLQAPYEIRTYRVNLRRRDHVTVKVNATDFDPVVWVTDPTGNIIGADYDTDGNRQTEIPFTADDTGDFFVNVHAKGDGAGAFTVFVGIEEAMFFFCDDISLLTPGGIAGFADLSLIEVLDSPEGAIGYDKKSGLFTIVGANDGFDLEVDPNGNVTGIVTVEVRDGLGNLIDTADVPVVGRIDSSTRGSIGERAVEVRNRLKLKGKIDGPSGAPFSLSIKAEEEYRTPAFDIADIFDPEGGRPGFTADIKTMVNGFAKTRVEVVLLGIEPDSVCFELFEGPGAPVKNQSVEGVVGLTTSLIQIEGGTSKIKFKSAKYKGGSHDSKVESSDYKPGSARSDARLDSWRARVDARHDYMEPPDPEELSENSTVQRMDIRGPSTRMKVDFSGNGEN